VSVDYNPTAQRAGAAIVGITYDVPDAATSARVTELQTRSVDVVDSVPGNEAGDNAILFGDGVLQSEITALLGDTAIIVFPAALLLILGFLVFAYRDPIDMTIGLVSLLMALLWTFGFMGYAGIPSPTPSSLSSRCCSRSGSTSGFTSSTGIAKSGAKDWGSGTRCGRRLTSCSSPSCS